MFRVIIAGSRHFNDYTIDDVTKMVAGQIGQLAPMDEEATDLFQQLAKKLIEQTGK